MRNSNSGSFKIESESENSQIINSKDNNLLEQNFEEIINSNENENYVDLNNEVKKKTKSLNNLNDGMDINYEKKISTRSAEEMKYEKNKDFPILRDFKQENLMKTYNPKNENVFKKKNIYKEDENDNNNYIIDNSNDNNDNDNFNDNINYINNENYNNNQNEDEKENKKLNINDLNNYIEKENKKYERELKDSTNSYKRKGKKNNKINNFNFSLKNPNKKNLTLGKKEIDSKNIQKDFLTESLDYNKSLKSNNYINTNYSSNNYLIIQPRNSPVFTELDYSKTGLKNIKSKNKNKKNYYSNFKNDKMNLYKVTIENVFNGINLKNFNKDLRNIIQNKNENYLKKSQKDFRNKSYNNLMILTNTNKNYNNTEKLYNKKNKVYDLQPLITENNYNDNKKRNNNYFDFSKYIKLHSLNCITPQNNFDNIFSRSYKKF